MSNGGGSGQTNTAGGGGATAGSGVGGSVVGAAGTPGAAGTASGGSAGLGGGAAAGMGGSGAGAPMTNGGVGGSDGPAGAIPLGNAPVPSTGCGKAQGITSGFKTINSGGREREYVIDIPENYDPNTPHLFFYVSHWINGDAAAMRSNNYYALKNEAEAANKPAIFLAASGINGSWGEADHPLFDALLAHVEQNLCIDTTRVFATGYSFGGMYTYSLSTNHQHKIRAAVGMAPANYNIWIPNPKKTDPIAWMQVHGLEDETCQWVHDEAKKQGGKYIVLEKAADNGCDIPAGGDFPVWQSGAHFCYEFEGCNEAHPVKICTNNGTHSGAEKYKDPGQSKSWVPPTVWEFFARF